MSLRRLRLTADQRPIEFMDIRFTEHGIETFKCLGSLCKHGYAADRTVKTMRQADEHLARLFITLGYEGLILFAERLVSGLVTLYDLPYLLVDHKKMIVLI